MATQIGAVEALEDGAGAARPEQIKGNTSIVAIIPALATFHGMRSGPCCLYRIFGIDMRHICAVSFWRVAFLESGWVYMGMGETLRRRDSDHLISLLQTLLHALARDETWSPPRALAEDSRSPLGSFQGWSCTVWIRRQEHHRHE